MIGRVCGKGSFSWFFFLWSVETPVAGGMSRALAPSAVRLGPLALGVHWLSAERREVGCMSMSMHVRITHVSVLYSAVRVLKGCRDNNENDLLVQSPSQLVISIRISTNTSIFL